MSNFVIIDFECTGYVPGYPNEAWQLGMVRFHDGKLIPDNFFVSLLKIGDRPFNKHAPGLYHRFQDKLKSAPTLQSLWPKLQEWWYGQPLVAHNISTEKKFLLETAPIHKPGPWIDTLKLSRIAWPELRSHKLEDLIEGLGLYERLSHFCPNRQYHDALYDAMACGLLLETLLSKKNWGHISSDDLVRAKPKDFYVLQALTSKEKMQKSRDLF